MALFAYPLLLLHFWYFESPVKLLRFFKNLNAYMINLLSIPLIFSTFFKPLKNEYRTGLIGFSIMMGVAFKSFLLFISFIFLFFIIICEILFLFGFLVFPFFGFYLFIL